MPQRVFLVADPDPLQRQLVDLLLADDGAETVGVSTARALLEFLRERTPNLIVIDQDLHDLEGTAAASRIKSVARLAHVPVILTLQTDGHGLSQPIRDRAASAGVDLVLPKPLGDKNFRDRARRLMVAASTSSRAGQGESTQVIEEALRDLGGQPAKDAAAGREDDAKTEPNDERSRLRTENERLKREVANLRMQLDRLRSEMSELKRGSQRRRGPFGRRRDA